MNTLDLRVGSVAVDRVSGHPRNRVVVEKGDAWEEWLGDLYRNGIQQPIVVRPYGEEGFYQIVKGHRRYFGWVALGDQFPKEARFASVPVLVKELSDAEALKELFRDNLLHETLSLVEEAEGVCALMEDLGCTAEEVGAMVSKSVEWVRNRQLLLELGDEVRERVCLPGSDPRHLGMGTVVEILAVPEGLRAEAVQMVLHCDIYEGTPRPAEARTLLRQALVEPRRAAEAWDSSLKKVTAEWKRQLRDALPKGMKGGLNLQGVGWADLSQERAKRPALEPVAVGECSAEAPVNLTWLVLAVRHGVPVKVVPLEGIVGSQAVVNEVTLRQLEAATVEGGGEGWLVGKKGRVESAKCEVRSETAPDAGAVGGRVGEALADIDGESSPEWVKEELSRPEAVVVEQSIERTVVVRMEVVLLLKQEAAGHLAAGYFHAGEIDAGRLRGWPEWATAMTLKEVIAVCEWVEGLKYTPKQ